VSLGSLRALAAAEVSSKAVPTPWHSHSKSAS